MSEKISNYTPYVIDRAIKLDRVLKIIPDAEAELMNTPNAKGEHVIYYTDDIGVLNQFSFKNVYGLKHIAQSLFEDLKDDGELEIAEEITYQNAPRQNWDRKHRG